MGSEMCIRDSFGANPQEAADLAAIAYRTSAMSLIPVANAMDGFATSHMLSEALMPEPGLLREYLGDPAGRIKAPTLAQELLFGAKGRVFQLNAYLDRHRDDFEAPDLAALKAWLDARAEQIEPDNAGDLVSETTAWVPQDMHAQWRRQWVNAFEKGTRQLVPALVDVNNPGLTGPVQNQPDFQAGAVDHRTHFASEVPRLVRQAMAEYGALTGRVYQPVHTSFNDDAEVVMIALGSVADDVEAVLPYLRSQGMKAGLVSVKLLQPFPEAEIVAALAGKRAVVVLERSDQMALTPLVTSALMKGLANARTERHPGIPALAELPVLSTAVFGLGGRSGGQLPQQGQDQGDRVLGDRSVVEAPTGADDDARVEPRGHHPVRAGGERLHPAEPGGSGKLREVARGEPPHHGRVHVQLVGAQGRAGGVGHHLDPGQLGGREGGIVGDQQPHGIHARTPPVGPGGSGW